MTGALGLADGIRSLIERRDALTAELASVHLELDEIGKVLKGYVPRVEDAMREDAAIVRACDVCGKDFTLRSPRQRMCQGCAADAPHRSVEELTGTQTPDSICEKCGKSFARGQGHSGRFCSRGCYALPIETRRERILAALATGPFSATDLAHRTDMHGISTATVANDLQALRREGRVQSSDEGWRLSKPDAVTVTAPAPPAVAVQPPRVAPVAPLRAKDVQPPAAPQPERRCSKCIKKFTPTKPGEYFCAECLAKKAPPSTPPVLARSAVRDEDKEFDVVWSPGKDAPSLTGERPSKPAGYGR